MVEPEHSAQSLAALDRSIAGRRIGSVLRKQNGVVFALMRPLGVIVLDVFADGMSKKFCRSWGG